MNRPSKAVTQAKKVAPPAVPDVFRHSGSSFGSAGYASSEDSCFLSGSGPGGTTDDGSYGMPSGKSPGPIFTHPGFAFPPVVGKYAHAEDQGANYWWTYEYCDINKWLSYHGAIEHRSNTAYSILYRTTFYYSCSVCIRIDIRWYRRDALLQYLATKRTRALSFCNLFGRDSKNVKIPATDETFLSLRARLRQLSVGMSKFVRSLNHYTVVSFHIPFFSFPLVR